MWVSQMVEAIKLLMPHVSAISPVLVAPRAEIVECKMHVAFDNYNETADVAS